MNGPIGYSEFVDLCQIDDPRDWGGFRVAGDGVYVLLPPDDVILFPAERAALTWHPTGNLLEPALRFPCTRSELQAFIKEIGFGEIELPDTDEDSSELPTLRAQEEAIIAKLRELGYDPKELPPNQSGKPGVRSKIRKALSESPLFEGKTTFAKAWERLSIEDIAYAKA